MHPRSLFSLAEHLERLSKDGDPLEVLAGTVDYRFGSPLTKGLGYNDGTKSGRLAFAGGPHQAGHLQKPLALRPLLCFIPFIGPDQG